MSNVNIRRDVKDAFYRYKMPKLQSKIEGKGNGIKTVIPNMADIAKALSRPPAYVTKFFGSELGAQTICDDKNSRYIVNGAHEAERLSTILDAFIQKFVLCPGCDNPETVLAITKDEKILRICKACGQRNTVDMLHKICTFILKNPGEIIKETSKVAYDNKSYDSAKDVSNMVSNLDIDDEDEDQEETFEAFATYLESHPDASDSDIYQKSKRLGIKKSKAIVIIVQVLFKEDVANEIPKKKSLLLTFTKENEKAQRALLGGVERLIGISYPSLEKKIMAILLALFNSDIVEEEVFLSWHSKVSKRYVDKETAKKIRTLAEPFITWLK